MGDVQSDDHVCQYVSIHFVSFHNDLSLSSHFPTSSSSFFALKFSHFSFFLLSLSLLFFDSAVFNGAKAFNSDISKWEVSQGPKMAESTFSIHLLSSQRYLSFSNPFDSSLSLFCFSSLLLSLSFLSFLTLQRFVTLQHLIKPGAVKAG